MNPDREALELESRGTLGLGRAVRGATPYAVAMQIAPFVCALVAAICGACSGPTLVNFPTGDGGIVYADLYGSGKHGVVLAHGGRFDRSSWAEQAPTIARAGYRTLAIDFRGRGSSQAGPDAKPDGDYHDVLAAVRFLRTKNVETVSVIGASYGGWASARAAVEAGPGEIDSIVLLAAPSIDEPERMQGRKLFITTRDDFSGGGKLRLPRIRDQYERAPEPKELVVLEGDAHAQFIFETDQGPRLMEEILAFLAE